MRITNEEIKDILKCLDKIDRNDSDITLMAFLLIVMSCLPENSDGRLTVDDAVELKNQLRARFGVAIG